MAINFIAKGAFASGTAALSVAMPTGYAAGDILIIAIESANQAISTPTSTSGTWTQVTNSPQYTGTAAAAGGVRLAVYWKVAVSSESAVTVADSGDHTTAIVLCFRGVDTVSPIHISAGSVNSTATSSLSCPAVTTTKDFCMILNIIGLDKDLADTDTLQSGANSNLYGFTETHDQSVSSGVGGGIAIFRGIKLTAGNIGNTTATGYTSTTHAYITLALTPQSSDGVNLPNLTTNGDFSNGTNGWVATYSSLSVANNICSVIGSGANASVYISKEDAGVIDITHKYYVRAKVKVTNAVCNSIYMFYDGSTAGTNKTLTNINNPTQNTEYIISSLDTPPTDATGNFKFMIRHLYADATTATDKVMEIREVICIDLTTCFGSGREPTLTQMDTFMNNLSYSTFFIFPITITNVLGTDGNFQTDSNSDGLGDGWSIYDCGSKSMANNIQSFTPSAQYGGLVISAPSSGGVTGDIYYGYGFLKSNAIGIYLEVRDNTAGGSFTASSSAITDFILLSGVYTLTGNADTVNPRVCIGTEGTSFGEIQVKNVGLINLTACFGKSKEPTKTQMDYFIQSLSSYLTSSAYKLILKNILEGYGNFTTDSNSNGIGDGFDDYPNNFSAVSISNNIQYFTPKVQYSGIVKSNMPCAVGDVLYACAYVVTSSNCYFGINSGGESPTYPSGTGFVFTSNLRVAASTTGKVFYLTGLASGWTEMQIKLFHFINLTACFGAGKEPSRGEMDLFMQNRSYFTSVIYSFGTPISISMDLKRVITNAFGISPDTKRITTNALDMLADTSRIITNGIEVSVPVDTKRIVNISTDINNDSKRSLMNTSDVSHDVRRNVNISYDMSNDTNRGIVINKIGLIDTNRSLLNDINIQSDTKRSIMNSFINSFDIKRIATILNDTNIDISRKLSVLIESLVDSERLLLNDIIADIDFNRSLSNNIDIQSDASRLIENNIQLDTDIFRQVLNNNEINIDTERIVTYNIIVNMYNDTIRHIINSTQTQTDTNRSILNDANIQSDIVRLIENNIQLNTDSNRSILSNTQFDIDTLRNIIAESSEIINFDTKRIILNSNQIQTDTGRSILNDMDIQLDITRLIESNIQLDTDIFRQVLNNNEFDIDTDRSIVLDIICEYHTIRNIINDILVIADTMRKIKTNSSADVDIDVIRKVVRSYNISSDTKRIVQNNQSFILDTLRKIIDNDGAGETTYLTAELILETILTAEYQPETTLTAELILETTLTAEYQPETTLTAECILETILEGDVNMAKYSQNDKTFSGDVHYIKYNNVIMPAGVTLQDNGIDILWVCKDNGITKISKLMSETDDIEVNGPYTCRIKINPVDTEKLSGTFDMKLKISINSGEPVTSGVGVLVIDK